MSGRISVWHTKPGRSLPAERVSSLVAAVLRSENVVHRYVGVVLADRDEVHRLNREYLDHDYPTDVLSFLLSESEQTDIEGEVYVDLDMAAEVGPSVGVSFRTEAVRYIIHGLLHLAGHEDDTPEKRAQMRALEDEYLARHWNG